MLRRPAAPERAGFTLIELLVAMVVSGILVGVIFQLLQGQGRFAQLQGAQEEVQQNARAALETVASELRAVPAGSIRMADRDSIRFALPRAWGVVCEPINATSTRAWFRFPTASVAPGMLPTTVLPLDWGMAIAETDSLYRPLRTYAHGVVLSDAGAPNPCDNLLPDPAGVTELGFAWAALFHNGVAIPAGARAFLFQETKYDAADGTIAGTSGRWLRRMAGYNGTEPAMQPLAGPLRPGGGLVLEYVDTLGAPIPASALPMTFPDTRKIGSIRVTVAMNSRAKLNGVARENRATTVVSLRN